MIPRVTILRFDSDMRDHPRQSHLRTKCCVSNTHFENWSSTAFEVSEVDLVKRDDVSIVHARGTVEQITSRTTRV